MRPGLKRAIPVFGSETKATASAQPKRQVHLAERIAPADLNRLLKDMPGTFDLVDIRPPEAFQDYALPGATNAELAEVLSNPAYLTGAGPLIIVDRDGSLAMMVAGILSQKTKRPIKALHGGLEGFWEETELKSAVRAVPLPGGSPKLQAAPAPTPAAPSTHLPPRRRRRRHRRRNRPVAEVLCGGRHAPYLHLFSNHEGHEKHEESARGIFETPRSRRERLGGAKRTVEQLCPPTSPVDGRVVSES